MHYLWSFLLLMPLLHPICPLSASPPASQPAPKVELRVLKTCSVRETAVSDEGDPDVLDEAHSCKEGLTALIELRGDALANVMMWYDPRISKLTDAAGNVLPAPRATWVFLPDELPQMYYGMESPPEDRKWVRLRLPLPEDGVKELRVSGSMNVILGKPHRDVLIEDVPQDAPLPEKPLQELGLRGHLARENKKRLVARFTGKTYFIQRVFLVGKDGEDIDGVREIRPSLSHATYRFPLPSPLDEQDTFDIRIVAPADPKPKTQVFDEVRLPVP